MTDPFHDSQQRTQRKEPLLGSHAPSTQPQAPPTKLENNPPPNHQHQEPVAADLRLPPNNSPDENYTPLDLPDFNHVTISHSQQAIPKQAPESLTLSIELGHQQLDPEAMQKLKRGSRIMLKQAAAEPVDLYIKQDFIGQGELLVRDNKLCIRIVHLATNTLRRSA
jgi:flagellar motor switch/type III secretory pathway protein FliN